MTHAFVTFCHFMTLMRDLLIYKDHRKTVNTGFSANNNIVMARNIKSIKSSKKRARLRLIPLI